MGARATEVCKSPGNREQVATHRKAEALWLFAPRDSLFFGTGQPFNAGEVGTQRSHFPPNPATMQGAIRGILLQAHGADFDALGRGRCSVCDCPWDQCPVTRSVGAADDPESMEFSLRGPFVAVRTRATSGAYDLLYPTPLDVASAHRTGTGTSGQKEMVRLTPSSRAVATDLGYQHLPTAPEGYENVSVPEHSFLPADDFYRYLLGETPQPGTLLDLRPGSASQHTPVVEETRVGIGRKSRTHTVEEGMLYVTRHVRLDDRYVLAERVANFPDILLDTKAAEPQKGIPLNLPPVVRLGGESRLSYLEIHPSHEGSRPPDGLPEGAMSQIADTLDSQRTQQGVLRFRLVVLQPARFKEGWIPDGIDPRDWSGTLCGIPVRLVSACLGKPVVLGGWDMARRQPKPTAAYVPAGSVYFLESTDPGCKGRQVVEALHDHKIGLQTKAGFGHVMVGCGW